MKMFEQLTKEEKLNLFEAWIDGKTIEVSNGNDNYVTAKPNWDYYLYYRIKETKPSINWDQVSKEYNYLFKGAMGSYLLTAHAPIKDHRDWAWLAPARADSHISFKPGTCDWKDSLVRRYDNDL